MRMRQFRGLNPLHLLFFYFYLLIKNKEVLRVETINLSGKKMIPTLASEVCRKIEYSIGGKLEEPRGKAIKDGKINSDYICEVSKGDFIFSIEFGHGEFDGMSIVNLADKGLTGLMYKGSPSEVELIKIIGTGKNKRIDIDWGSSSFIWNV